MLIISVLECIRLSPTTCCGFGRRSMFYNEHVKVYAERWLCCMSGPSILRLFWSLTICSHSPSSSIRYTSWTIAESRRSTACWSASYHKRPLIGQRTQEAPVLDRGLDRLASSASYGMKETDWRQRGCWLRRRPRDFVGSISWREGG